MAPATSEMLANLFLIQVTWAVLALLLFGLGLLLCAIFRIAIRDCEMLFGSFWIGWCFLLLLLLAWNQFLPVRPFAYVPVCILAVSGFVLRFSQVYSVIRGIRRGKLLFLFVLFLFSIWLSNRAIGPVQNFDSGLYHLNAIRWANEYPAIPGLANLHSRLGFVSGHLLYFAFLNVGIWFQKSQHLGNGLLLMAFAACILLSAIRIWLYRRISLKDVARLFLVVPLAILTLTTASDTFTDLPTLLLSLIITIHLCGMVYGERRNSFDIFFIATLVAGGIVCKMYFLVFGGVAFAVAIRSTDGWKNFSLYVPAALLLILWMVRSITLSGYPLYPIPYAGLSVSWQVPESQAKHLSKTIQNYAKLPEAKPEESLSMRRWFPVWLSRLLSSTILQLLVVLPILVFILATLNLAIRKPHDWKKIFVILLPSFAGLVFWIFSAPDPRFASGAFWCLSSISLARSMVSPDEKIHSKFAALYMFLLLLFCASLFRIMDKAILLPPGPDQGFYQTPTPELKRFVTDSGLSLYVPKNGTQCWQSELLCTPWPHSRLALRDPKNLGSGFSLSP